MTTTEQKKAAARVKALLAKTVENGATEEEALAAMEKARAIMDKHGLTEEAVKADAETIAPETTLRDNFKTYVIKDHLALQVAAYCDCKVWLQKRNGTYTLFGTEQDRQFAIWLLNSLDQFIRHATVRYMEEKGFKGGAGPWPLQTGFMQGAIARINVRLRQLIEERCKNAATGTGGRSLVVVKNKLVENAFAKLNMKLRSGSGSGAQRGDGSAFTAGMAAGDRANFARPINGGAGVKAIGRG